MTSIDIALTYQFLHIHNWLQQAHVALFPAKRTGACEPGDKQSAGRVSPAWHIVQDRPDNDTNILLTTADTESSLLAQIVGAYLQGGV